MKQSTRNPPRKPVPKPSQAVVTPAQPAGKLSPLAYMLKVLNDPAASLARRDAMATRAARYLHRRPADSAGKKDLLAEAAREAGGEEWAGDLDPTRPQ